MYKILGVVWTVAIGVALAVTQEELAQYVAQQQTAAALGGGLGGARRQPFLLSPQPKAAAYQPEPRQQVYQIQPKPAAYQAPKVYQQAQSEQQYYQPPQPQQAPSAQYYQPRPQAAPAGKLARPQPGQQLDDQQQLPEDYDPNPQYQFGFDIKDDEFTNYQNRKEQREGGKISGSYSVVDSDGYIRTVTYTADPLEGFKADVVREPTDIKIKLPQPQLLQGQSQQLQYEPQGLSARKQQTQQYLQGSVQPKQQYALRPEQAQQQRQYSASPYQGQLQYQQ